MMQTLLRMVALATLTLVLAGCEQSYESMAEARATYAHNGQGPIVVAVVDDPGQKSYLRGIELAAKHINENAGGLIGRPLEIRVFPGGSSFEAMRPTIRRITGDPRISAVMGHRFSHIAIRASIAYETADLLFYPSFATDPKMTRHRFTFILRMLPDSAVMATQSASIAQLFGYRRIAVIHGRDKYSRNVAFLFEDAARSRGITMSYRSSFFSDEENFHSIIGNMALEEFDAIYLSASSAPSAHFVRQLREMGIFKPVIGSDAVISGDAFRMAVGSAGDQVIAPISYDPSNRMATNRRFVADYKEHYDATPDAGAALGYDTLLVFANTVERTGLTEPAALSAAAHFGAPAVGITGFYAHDLDGDVLGKTLQFKVLRNRRWRSLKAVEAPYRIADLNARVETLGGASSQTERLLAMSHAFYGFKRLGFITYPDQEADWIGIANRVGSKHGFTIVPCTTAPPEDAEDQAAALFDETKRCYSQLVNEVDALLDISSDQIDPDALRRLNRALRAYGVASFAIDDNRADRGLTFALSPAEALRPGPAAAELFEGLLAQSSIADLSRTLANTPVIAVDFDALETMGIRLPPAALAAVGEVLKTSASDPLDSPGF